MVRTKCGTASNREKQMTGDASRLVRPGVVAQWSAAKTATSQYCQVAREDYDAPQGVLDLLSSGTPLDRAVLKEARAV